MDDGAQRPDGYTLHRTNDDALAHIRQHWAEEKQRNPTGKTPSYYRRPGTPYLVYVNRATLTALNNRGILRTEQEPPLEPQ